MRKILTIMLLAISCVAVAQTSDSLQVQLSRKWAHSKTYALELVALFPEADYGFKPSSEEMSFEEQVLHITDNMNWLSSSYLFTDVAAKRVAKERLSKEKLLQLLADAYDRGLTAHKKVTTTQLNDKVKFFSGPMTRQQILILMHDHQTHHLGQLIVYLRLKGIKPPDYVGW